MESLSVGVATFDDESSRVVVLYLFIIDKFPKSFLSIPTSFEKYIRVALGSFKYFKPLESV